MAGVSCGRLERQVSQAAGAACRVLALTLLWLVGCDSGDTSLSLSSVPAIQVLYREAPLAGVEVSLYGPTSDGLKSGQPKIDQPLAVAITRDDGKAYFTDVPSPEPNQYRLALKSVGDGGWILDPKVIKPFCQSQTLDPLSSSPVQELTLPDRAVRSLVPGRPR